MIAGSETTPSIHERLSPVFLRAILGQLPHCDGDAFRADLADQARRRLATALAEVVGRTVQIDPADSSAAIAMRDVAACCRFTFGENRRNACTLLLNGAAATAIIAPLLADHFAIQSSACLLETERAVLDYALTAWADRINNLARDARQEIAIDRIDHEDEDIREIDSIGARIDLTITIAPHVGSLTLHLPLEPDVRHLAAWVACGETAEVEEPDWPSAGCTLRVALPPVSSSECDLTVAKPGDAVLLGRTELCGPADAVMLCSDAGWHLGRVELRHDSPTVLAAELLNLDPWPMGQSEDAGVLYFLIGRLRLTGRQLARLRPGDRIDLAKTPDASGGDVLLRLAGRDVGCGRIVRACGELAVQITSLADRRGA